MSDRLPPDSSAGLSGRLAGLLDRVGSRGEYREPSSDPSDPAVEFRDVSKRFGPVTALDGIDCRFDRGGIHGVVGPNGSGKTTLFEVLLRLRRPTSGTVTAPPPAAIGYSFQEPQFYPNLTAGENLSVFTRLHGDVDPEWRRSVTERLRLDRVRHQRAAALSGGFRKKLDVAIAFVSRPELLVLDEPLAGIDRLSRERVIELIVEHAQGGGTVLVSSHDREHVDPILDSSLALYDGRVGRPE
ncbi:ABC-2 type transport system ATP-binding protein [Halorubrum aquaticum]|uniref:ABC-2 type transport system ATP-binding protein n=1 Tax=Halorubrum aquaticum TaxID=387340 RepID=A0A1I3C1Z3_9EURY|nr:ABC transporter ATP-binding protein [Halorubrum aquaticum]SFH67991.1 ABC-2 type transport system ATP-binding protein [Halorubrum aquaticum]